MFRKDIEVLVEQLPSHCSPKKRQDTSFFLGQSGRPEELSLTEGHADLGWTEIVLTWGDRILGTALFMLMLVLLLGRLDVHQTTLLWQLRE